MRRWLVVVGLAAVASSIAAGVWTTKLVPVVASVREDRLVVVEVSRKTGGGEETLRLLSDLGYRLFRLARGKEVPSRLRPLRKLPRHDNVIAVPS